jgi:hypothetical protein
MTILLGHEQRIRDGSATLGDLAMAESDCSSARKRGDLYVEHFSLYSNYVYANMIRIAAASLERVICKRSLRMLLSA